jgi:D-beta-D-heptose 7-phosphate kinase/D-beta-D-heptose 1-phosphate adenosyltransferase
VLALREDGGLTLADGGPARHLATAALGISDMSGVIDSVVAVVAAALASGSTLPVAALIANAASGIVAGAPGPGVTEETELLAALAV